MDRPRPEVQALETLLRRISYRLNLYTRCYLARKRMTLARFWVISTLSGSSPLTMGELQRRLQLAPATLTGLVNGLVEGELARRWRDDRDRRLVYLELTPAGRRLLEEVADYRAAVLQSALRDHPSFDLQVVNTDLEALLRCIESLHHNPEQRGENHACQNRK